MNSQPVHDFQECLERSQVQADAPWWGLLYRASFPGFVRMEYVSDDLNLQRAGIDRKVFVKNMGVEKTIYIDEKVRTKAWADVLLEIWSDKERRIRGWAWKDLACDYIAYAYLESRVAYLFPFPVLRRAFEENWISWCNEYGTRIARNVGYETESVPVPLAELFRCIANATAVRWGNDMEDKPDADRKK